MSEYFLWQFGKGKAPTGNTPIRILNYLPGQQELIESQPWGGRTLRERGRELPDVITFTVPVEFPLDIHQTHTIKIPQGTHPISIVNIQFAPTFYGMQKVATAYVMD